MKNSKKIENEKIENEKNENIKYLSSFGVKYEEGKFVVRNKDKIEAAYKKAWESRDFEINKFWTRAAYFWGFLVLIFGAYFTNYNKFSKEDYTLFYIICIGLIFSFAWTFVIIGSKRWQENWEIHITKLENYVSGPLYKTINSKGKIFYSVSKINEILSHLIIVIWIVFFIEYILCSSMVKDGVSWSDSRIAIGILITLFFIYRIKYGYGKSSVSINEKINGKK